MTVVIDLGKLGTFIEMVAGIDLTTEFLKHIIKPHCRLSNKGSIKLLKPSESDQTMKLGNSSNQNPILMKH